MNKKKIYYAHCQSIYNTVEEERNIITLEKLGFEVVNPNKKEHDEGYKKKGMVYFQDLLTTCNALAFSPLPDGLIPAGVAQEIEWAGRLMYPIIELPAPMLVRTLTVEETKEYLRAVGQR